MGGVTCPECGTRWVRHIKHPVTLRDAIAFDGPFPDEWDWFYFDKDDWWRPEAANYVWLPIKEQTYEEGVVQYTQWVAECRKTKDQLLVVFVDLGLVRGGGDTPWIGSVMLGAFRGKFLDNIEADTDDDMTWLKIAYKFAAEPKAKWMSCGKIQQLVHELVQPSDVV